MYLIWPTILFMDLVSDNILQMALGSDLLIKFGGGMLHNIDHLLHIETTSSHAIIYKENRIGLCCPRQSRGRKLSSCQLILELLDHSHPDEIFLQCLFLFQVPGEGIVFPCGCIAKTMCPNFIRYTSLPYT